MSDLTINSDGQWERESSKFDAREFMKAYGKGTVYAEWEIWFVENYDLVRWGQLMVFPIWTLISTTFGLTGATIYAYLSVLFPFLCLRKVPTKPDPHVGIVKLLGNRQPIPLQTGWHVVPFFCFLLKFPRPKVNKDWEYGTNLMRDKPIETGLRKTDFLGHLACAMTQEDIADSDGGGNVAYHIGATFEIDWSDPRSIIYLDDAGEFDEVMNIVHDQIGNFLRGTGRRLTWREAMLASDVVGMIVMAKLGGFSVAPFRDPNRITDEAIENFMKLAFQNGITLIHGVGTKISRLDIKRVVPDPDLLDAAKQRELKALENAGILENAKVMRNALRVIKYGEEGTKRGDGSINDQAALEAVLVNDPNARFEKKAERREYAIDPTLIKAMREIFGRKRT